MRDCKRAIVVAAEKEALWKDIYEGGGFDKNLLAGCDIDWRNKRKEKVSLPSCLKKRKENHWEPL